MPLRDKTTYGLFIYVHSLLLSTSASELSRSHATR
jgi:hypothetical protein